MKSQTEMLKQIVPYILVGVVAVGLFAYANKKISSVEYDYAEQAKELSRLHKEELDKLAAARQVEKEQLEANIVKLQNDLKENQKDYEKKLAELNVKKEQEAKRLTAKAPVDLADDVSKATGFRIYR